MVTNRSPRAAFVAVALAAVSIGVQARASTPPPSVVVTPVVQSNVSTSLGYIGHVIAIQSVKLVPRVTAFIDQVTVKRGSDVKAGQVLFKLQTAQYQAALQTAEANLASAQAALANANVTYERALHLNNSGFSPTSTLDENLATRNEDQANILSATASIALAQLNLSYCTITAPIDGRIGDISLTKGNLVTPSTSALATINQLDPIRVVFAVSTDSPLLYSTHSSVIQQDERGDPNFKVNLDLPNGKPYPQTGRIAFFDNQVDTGTGTVNIYADFPNPRGLLLPGAYVSVQVAPAKPKEALLVPVAAIQTDQNSSFVLVVGPDKKVTQQTVTIGDQIDQNYIVKSGLTVGQDVIVDGIQKVKVGSTVSVTYASPSQSNDSSATSADSQ
ncbi:efflux RND transporter periplasmic adaptor subunit [Acidisoma sp.]|uniref:efflux RND transporter periplasmic adaptor subunit n=1 Tax=Acidisoma sp. TaxID=1872115 RepID=UPI003B009ECF